MSMTNYAPWDGDGDALVMLGVSPERGLDNSLSCQYLCVE